MILVVLALVWVVALTPTVLRRLAQRDSSYSVARFHHSLRAMRRATPGSVTPRSSGFQVANPRAVEARTKTASEALAAPSYDPERGARIRQSAGPSGPTARRRRHVLGVLVTAFLGTLLLGSVPGLAFFWDISLIAVVSIAGYVGLLIYFRRVVLERSRKVVYIQDRRVVQRQRIPAEHRTTAGRLVLGGYSG